uniref:Transcription factor Dp1 putative n=1 Tax=Albugo laibachii Nc14 TaxID=890382 RepID=F0W2T7_9STRA|nr:transcription factor Dp1 putative [Albugo laibachii Nc14]|eukprot:CCA15373.1 transcription factor Dp1 putative [Albugo laibachii Nc14]
MKTRQNVPPSPPPTRYGARKGSSRKRTPISPNSNECDTVMYPSTRKTRRELKIWSEKNEQAESKTDTSSKQGLDTSAEVEMHSFAASSLHDDFVNLMRAQGLENMATEAGIMRNGTLLDVSTHNLDQQGSLHSDPTFRHSMNGKSPATFYNQSSLSPSLNVTSTMYPTKRRKYAKVNKGLRHFSMKVCQKVEEKHVTSYNEVADELVREFVTSRPNDAVYDEKNIRRRVYDALNVLMAMNIISKERKEIRWIGFPNAPQPDAQLLMAERNERLRNLERKKQHLQDLLVQEISLKKLFRRNAALTQNKIAMNSMDEGRIFLPFIVVNTNKDTMIQCEMSEDREDIFFNFSAPFEINDDTEILRRLQLHRCSRKDLEGFVGIKELLPFVPSDCEVEEKNESKQV